MAAKRYYFQTEETVTTTRKGYVLIEEDFMQVYHSVLAVSPFLHLGTSYQLLFWIGVNMNESNIIHIGEKTLEQFNEHLKIADKKASISRTTFFRAVEELKKTGVLTKVGRAYYYLNPHFFWKGTQKARIEFIKDENLDNRYVSYNPNKLETESELKNK